jgi:hypothetical protein
MIFAMFYMTVSHIYRMYLAFDLAVMDFTMYQMVLTMKITAFAYNYSDGDEREQKQIMEGMKPSSKAARFNSSRDLYSLTCLPNPLEYFGYIYCFTNSMAGPAFEYTDYYCGMKRISKSKVGTEGEKDACHASPVRHSFFLLFQGVVFLIINQAISKPFPCVEMSNVALLSANPWYINLSKAALTLVGERCKYFFAWKVAESSCVAAGFGYLGPCADGTSHKWHGVANVDVLNFELACSTSRISRKWNMRTQVRHFFLLPVAVGAALQTCYTYSLPKTYSRTCTIGLSKMVIQQQTTLMK